MYKKYFRDISPIGCFSDVIIKDKRADGSKILMYNKPAILLINKNSIDQFVLIPKKNEKINSEKNELVLNSISKMDFKKSTFLNLYRLTVAEKSVQEVYYESITILDKEYVAFKYKNKDFVTNELYREIVQPLYPQIGEDYSGEVIYADEPVDFIPTGSIIPTEWTFTSDDILFISPDLFNKKRLFTYDEAKDFDSDKELFHFKNANELDIDINSDRRKNNDILKNYSISQLFHITHLDNIQNIMKKGILSHNIAHGDDHIVEDISLESVNDKRNFIEPYHNRNIHDYVPLYFTPKNPMLFLRKAMSEELVMLAITSEIMLDETCLFTDGNAASRMTSIFKDYEKLNQLDWDCLADKYWNNHPDGKRKKCSEVLVLERIKKKYISKVIVNNNSLKNMVEKITNIPTIIKQSYFFK